jgi:hypothetical protein
MATYVIFEKLPKVNNRRLGENRPIWSHCRGSASAPLIATYLWPIKGNNFGSATAFECQNRWSGFVSWSDISFWGLSRKRPKNPVPGGVTFRAARSYNIPKQEKMYQITPKSTKGP